MAFPSIKVQNQQKEKQIYEVEFYINIFWVWVIR